MLPGGDWKSIRVVRQRNGRSEDGRVVRARGIPSRRWDGEADHM